MATRGSPLPAFTLARLLKLAAAGVPRARIARECGVSRMTVYRQLRAAGMRRAA